MGFLYHMAREGAGQIRKETRDKKKKFYKQIQEKKNERKKRTNSLFFFSSPTTRKEYQDLSGIRNKSLMIFFCCIIPFILKQKKNPERERKPLFFPYNFFL